jgi:excisionase family DNA binding protein
MNADSSSENLYTVKDIKKRYMISERTVFTLLRRGELTGFKVGNVWRFRESDIVNFEERQRRKAEESRSPKQSSVDEVRRPLVDDGEFGHKDSRLVADPVC